MTSQLVDMRLSPVLIHELKRRMRGRHTHIVLMIYLGIVGALAVLLYTTSFLSSARTAGSSGGVGAAVFYFLVSMQLLLVVFVVPAMAAGTVSQERQNRTLDLLRLTPFNSAHIVRAKLAAELGLVALLLLVTLPLFSLAFMLGGVELKEWTVMTGIILVSALTYLLIGVCISARARTTTSAVAQTYLIVLSMAIGAPVIGLLNAATISGRLLDPNVINSSIGALLVLLVDAAANFGLGTSAISTAVFTLSSLSSNADIWLASGFSGITTIPTPLVFFVGIHLTVSTVCYARAVRGMNLPDADY